MATLTYHRKKNGTTYVYHQESYWDKIKKHSSSRQVCLGKLGDGGRIIYNNRFSTAQARESLEKGEVISESLITGQSLIFSKAITDTGLGKVLRSSFGNEAADKLISLACSVVATGGTMYNASVWIEDHDCPAHDTLLTSQDISRLLSSIKQGQIEDFLRAWMIHRNKGNHEQYCFDITSISSYNKSNPFVEYGYNRDREKLPQINLAILAGVASRIPTYYEVLPGSMSDVKSILVFTEKLKKYGVGTLRMLLDRGFYSDYNLSCLLKEHISFYIPVPTNIKWGQELIDRYRDDVEMPEHILSVTDDRKDAVYAMTVTAKMDGHRVWQHIYYDTARRTEHILSFFANLAAWEEELKAGNTKKDNEWAYERYFIVKNTTGHGRKVTRNQLAINAYKIDRAGYWVILTSCEKNAASALEAYRERSLAEQSFDDLKNELDMKRLRTHNSDTMRGRVLVQFLALIITAQIRTTLDSAWTRREEHPKDNRLSRRYSLSELMLRLGSYRKTKFSGRYGEVTSTPTKAQREIFTAFGILSS
jgi:transposase